MRHVANRLLVAATAWAVITAVQVALADDTASRGSASDPLQADAQPGTPGSGTTTDLLSASFKVTAAAPRVCVPEPTPAMMAAGEPAEGAQPGPPRETPSGNRSADPRRLRSEKFVPGTRQTSLNTTTSYSKRVDNSSDSPVGQTAPAAPSEGGAGSGTSGVTDEYNPAEHPLAPAGNAVRQVHGDLGLSLVMFQQPETGGQPVEVAPRGVAEVPASLLAQVMARAPEVPGAPSETALPPHDAAPQTPAGLLLESPTVQSVKVRRRTTVSLEPNIRGLQAGQIYTLVNGVYWTPARRDLDTVLSNIDPGMIQDVVVIPGPYRVRYGPGFAFIDVTRAPTPRYQSGPESHANLSGSTFTNGGQVYGRATAYGGATNWGYRLSYGHRRGNDYVSGDDTTIPSSYNNRDVWGELGFDINPYQRVEFAYQRLDQTDTEYPGQFFDISFLKTYGFELRLVDEDPAAPWSKLFIEGWYNRTAFRGDTSAKNNPNFPVMQRVDWALDEYFGRNPTDVNTLVNQLNGNTEGALDSSGVRTGVTFGEPTGTQLRLGADYRYVGQVIAEHYVETPDFALHGLPSTFDTNMPHSWLNDPGLYAEWSAPIFERWRASLGGRVDWIATRARTSDLRPDSNLCGDESLVQNDVLYAFYQTNQFELSKTWTLHAGFGHAQRPPTLVERYADGLFLAIVQSGFTRVIGYPSLKPERDWQIDAGISADADWWRGDATFFHAWLPDYITLEDGTVTGFADARLVRFTNTEFATLVGFELQGEMDLFPRLSAFGKMSYVQGQDQEIGAPLPAIPPLDSTVGLRLHDVDKGRRWGIEMAARMVADQDRRGVIRSGPGTVILEEHTGGFTVCNLRGYWNYTENLRLVAGINNLFDRNYQEHLDLRLFGPTGFPLPATRVWTPGITPYFAVDWTY
jgi:iron complex outermembrane receptor protein